MRQKPTGIWIEAAFLVVCLVVGLAIAILFTPETAQPIVGTLRFSGLIESTSARQVTDILDEARRDPRVAAMVLEIDSYGGTATSSESIFHAMLQFRQEKPLVVVIDGAATSGGYYMAVAGSRLLTTANSELGNVGAWTMRPIDPQIYADVISTGPFKLTGGSRFDAINSLQLTRDTFATSVVFQRQLSKMNPLKISQAELMEGRAYMGAQAQALGLVDELGGLSDGILAAANSAGLRNYQVKDLPEYLGKPFVPTEIYFLPKVLQSSLPETVFLLDSRVPAAAKAATQPAGSGAKSSVGLAGVIQDILTVRRREPLMSTTFRRLVVLLLGLVLLVGPSLIAMWTGYVPSLGGRYAPPESRLPDLAATPIPTSTPIPMSVTGDSSRPDAETRQVVVDLAHYGTLYPAQFQPLADNLAAYGMDLTFWMSDTSLMDLTFETMADLPDQSATLAEHLRHAAGLVVVNPSFWWTPEEIAVVQEFVADGGRLILISDPDVAEPPDYYSPDINTLSDAFGVVFSKDYLYNVSKNDLNFTHVFQDEFLDSASELAGKSIVFYGTRSIGGPAQPQFRTGDGTLSSLRAGMTGFTTLAIGGQGQDVSEANVLAMGDLDVMTEPYVNRFDNQAVVRFVAKFLADGRRQNSLDDFPAYHGQQVSLLFASDGPLEKDLLAAGSRLQRMVEDSGREMTLVGPQQVALTHTVVATASQDVVFVGSFEAASQQTTLLADSGIRLTREPLPAEETPTATPTPETADNTEEGEVVGEGEATEEGTPEPEETLAAVADAETTPEAEADVAEPAEATSTEDITTTLVLELEAGPRFLASDSVILLRRQDSQGHWVTAALGGDADSEEGMIASIDRLLSGDFSDCLTYPDMAVCPVSGTSADEEIGSDEDAFLPSDISGDLTVDGDIGDDASLQTSDVLLIDDDSLAQDGDVSEAQVYFAALLDTGHFPDMWYTSLDGIPDSDDLSGYTWVIWSAGEYEQNLLGEDQVATLIDFYGGGGTITMSGRQLPVESDAAASTLADVVLTQDIPELAVDLPTDPIVLPDGLPPVVPLPPAEEDGDATVLVRGDDSEDAAAPVMLVGGTDGAPTAGEPQAIVIAMSLTWLPEENATQLVTNMSNWVFGE